MIVLISWPTHTPNNFNIKIIYSTFQILVLSIFITRIISFFLHTLSDYSKKGRRLVFIIFYYF